MHYKRTQRVRQVVFCILFLQNLDTLCTERHFSGGVIWCYSERAAVPSSLGGKVRFHEGVRDNIDDAQRQRPCLVIQDDLLNVVYSQQVCDLFTKGSLHSNINVILITQNLFHQGQYCSNISLNAKYLVQLKTVRDKNQFMHLALQVYLEHSSSLYKAYLDATKRPHGYLILDLSQDTDDVLRFRTNVFPGEGPQIIYAAVGEEDEAGEIEFPSPPRAQAATPKLLKVIISNCGRENVHSMCECVLNGNIRLPDCVARKLRKHRAVLQKVVDKRVSSRARRSS